MREIIDGFADELEKLSYAPPGMRRAEARVLDIVKQLHKRIGGEDPGVLFHQAQIDQLRERLARSPAMEWLARALKTGEVARLPGTAPVGRPPLMERVVQFGEPLSDEDLALRIIGPGALGTR